MELKNGYKKTEIGCIPNDWNVFKIQELIDDKAIIGHLDGNHGALYPKSNEFKSTGVPYIGATDFENGKVNFRYCKFISDEKAKLFRKGIARDGDVLFAHNATVGPVALLRTRHEFVILSTTATYFRCNINKLNNDFLQYALQSASFIRQYTSVMAQSTRFQVPITAQRKFYLVVPGLEEQTAIATALADTDALINSIEKLVAKKRNIRQGVMQQLLKPKNGWGVQKLKDYVKITNGESPSKFKFVKEGIPYFKVEQLNNCEKYQIHSPYQIEIENVIPGGSIIFPKRGASILLNKVRILKTDSYMDTNLMTLTLSDEVCNEFIYYMLIYIELWRIADTTSIPQINNKHINSIEVSLPPMQEQQYIAKVLSDIDTEITALESKLSKYHQVKTGMMQNLLTGKIRLV